jgi:3-methylcrotonyl-CoA carboxylase alpha subunit
MEEAGVPVTPGYLGANQDPEHLAKEAQRIGYPVLIKAVAGGGGKGMRKVDKPGDFADALVSCKREAQASFGNDICLLEKWVQSPRHIEVQVFGDAHGNVVHLFERDCSLQRRHQKVIEEAPAPGMSEETRAAICGAAVRAAKAVDYESAGTIEFIADGSDGLRADRIYFMEMNTRLQVEHPVTEEITGVDLVEWQLRVASGEPIPKKQDELSINGHAIEARLYAEDPANGFLPTSGEIIHMPFDITMRIDSGYDYSEIPAYYDPMIAKLICSTNNRRSDSPISRRVHVIESLCKEMRNAIFGPIKTNANFLYRALNHPDFKSGNIDTGFIDRHIDDLIHEAPLQQIGKDVAADYFLGYRFENYNYQGRDIYSRRHGFRLNAHQSDGITMECNGEIITGHFNKSFRPANKRKLPDHMYFDGEKVWLNQDGQTFQITLLREEGGVAGTATDGTIISPMPGKIIAVAVAEGDSVAKGDKLVTLEAMKMEHTLTAPFDGVVQSLSASVGAQVVDGAVLAEITAHDA